MTLVRYALLAVLTVAICQGAASAALSRQWKATPDALARDYVLIIDQRDNREIVVVGCIVPTMIKQDMPGAQAVTSMLTEEVIIVAAHGHQDQLTGAISFEDVDALTATDGTGRSLTSVSRDELPPTYLGMITAIEATFKQTIGALGAGMKTFIFQGEGVDACKKGVVSVAVASETYTWDTPVPGCPAR